TRLLWAQRRGLHHLQAVLKRFPSCGHSYSFYLPFVFLYQFSILRSTRCSSVGSSSSSAVNGGRNVDEVIHPFCFSSTLTGTGFGALNKASEHSCHSGKRSGPRLSMHMRA